MATALTFRSRLIDAAAIAYGLYWVIYYHLYHLEGRFVGIFLFGQLVLTVASKNVNYLLIKDREKDFVRVEAGRRGQDERKSAKEGA